MPEPIRKTQVRSAERERRRKEREARARLWRTIPLVLVALLALLGFGMIAYGALNPSPDIQGKQGPRVQVDQETVDLGDEHFGTTVRATFKVTNAGDGTLRLDVPKIATVVEGC